MVNVLMCGNHPDSKGGMTTVIDQILKHNWNSRGIKIKFIPTYYPGNNVIKIFYFFLALIKIIFLTITNKPDIIYMHMSYKGSFWRKYIIHRWSKLLGIKTIIHLHGSEFEKWYNTTSESSSKRIVRILKECDKFIVLGNEWANIISKIEPDVDLFLLQNAVKEQEVKVEWNTEECTYVFLGVLIERKGVLDLVKAVKLLKDNNKWEKRHLLIAGTGEQEYELKKYIEEYGMTKDVTFTGWIDSKTKAQVLSGSQIMVLPSYNEGLPVSILEGMSYGMPIISTNVGDIELAVKDGINGYVVTPGNIELLAEKIDIVGNLDVFSEMACQSKEIVNRKFSEKEFFIKLEECMLKL
ncbi:glycosyltransferase [Atopococcus tabaci]|uniref:glycosyltransferase n=1 Tax=Atopococcus tabaci TaxID=269774 RepID=UPI000425B9AB|nr:glycosyltransferase [Atopococcus tabaci]